MVIAPLLRVPARRAAADVRVAGDDPARLSALRRMSFGCQVTVRIPPSGSATNPILSSLGAANLGGDRRGTLTKDRC